MADDRSHHADPMSTSSIATGHMHVADAPIDLSRYTLEAWISLAFFWVLRARHLLPVLHPVCAQRLRRRGPRRSRATC